MHFIVTANLIIINTTAALYYLPLYYIVINTGRHDSDGHYISSCCQDVRNLRVLLVNKKSYEQRNSSWLRKQQFKSFL